MQLSKIKKIDYFNQYMELKFSENKYNFNDIKEILNRDKKDLKEDERILVDLINKKVNNFDYCDDDDGKEIKKQIKSLMMEYKEQFTLLNEDINSSFNTYKPYMTDNQLQIFKSMIKNIRITAKLIK